MDVCETRHEAKRPYGKPSISLKTRVHFKLTVRNMGTQHMYVMSEHEHQDRIQGIGWRFMKNFNAGLRILNVLDSQIAPMPLCWTKQETQLLLSLFLLHSVTWE